MSGALEVRLTKIAFLVREIDLAAKLAHLCAGNGELARVWARRALIRCADLIDHAEAIRKDILTQCADYQVLKETRIAYDQLFDEHFRVVRDRVAAHLQDIEFVERVDVWNRIDAGAVSVFVDGAREIYERCLGGMCLPGYSAFAPFPERDDESLASAIRSYTMRARAPAEIGVDSFAITRPNTVTLMNLSSVHQRAQMIVAAQRWIRAMALFAFDPSLGVNLRRLAKADLVTTIIAMGDGLFTRTGGGVKEQMLGLDTLVTPKGVSVFRRWATSTKLRDLVEQLRPVRNSVGAHLDADPHVSLADLLARLDAVDPEGLRLTFGRLTNLFREVCREEIYLTPYLADGEPLFGVISGGSTRNHRPYDLAVLEAAPRETVYIDPAVSDSIDAAIDRWCRTNNAELGSELWSVSGSGPVTERYTCGSRIVDLRLFHARFAEHVRTSDSSRFFRLLQLAERVGNNTPTPLVEVIMRAVEARDATLHERALVAAALSRIPVHPRESGRVEPFLMALLQNDLAITYTAFFALYQRADRERTDRTDAVSADLLVLVEGRSCADRAIAIAALISHVWSCRNCDVKALEHESFVLADAAIALLPNFPGTDVQQLRSVARGDAVGLLVLLALQLEAGDPDRERLLRTAVSSDIAPPNNRALRRHALLNRATAWQMLNEHAQAREICEQVWAEVDFCRPKECITVLERCVAYGIDSHLWAAAIRECCNLDNDDLQRLKALLSASQ